MEQTTKYLYDEIQNLPFEKVGNVLAFLRFIKQEPETELLLDPAEEEELYNILSNEDGIGSSEMLALIKELPDD